MQYTILFGSKPMSELEIPKHQPWFETAPKAEEIFAAQTEFFANIQCLALQMHLSPLEQSMLARMQPRHLRSMLYDREVDDAPDGTIALQCVLEIVLRHRRSKRREMFSMLVAESRGLLALNELSAKHRLTLAKVLAGDYADSLIESLNETVVGNTVEHTDGETDIITDADAGRMQHQILQYYPVLTEWYERCIAGTLPLYSAPASEH